MKLFRLARIFEIKYGLISEANDHLLVEIKRDLRDIYRTYFSRSVKDSMFQYLSDIGENQGSKLVHEMDYLIKDIDKHSPKVIMNFLNRILKLIYQMKNDPDKKARQAILDSVIPNSQAQVNLRNRLLQKLERSMSYSFSALQKIAEKLQIIVPDAVHGGTIERQRAELTKQQLIDFVLMSSPFKNYNIDSLDIIEKLLSDPELKEKLTTLIYAIRSGRIPRDGPEIADFAKRIKNTILNKSKNNSSFFDEEEFPTPTKLEID